LRGVLVPLEFNALIEFRHYPGQSDGFEGVKPPFSPSKLSDWEDGLPITKGILKDLGW
jgi:hypothetical protein